jgi:uncharacterized protein (TIGR02611 family)
VPETPSTAGEREPPKLVRKLREKRESHLERGMIYRGAFVVAGVVIALGGLVLLVTPGPAFLVILIGLAILSLEFAWAERLLEKALMQADSAKDRAKETSARQRVLVILAVLAGAGAALALALHYDIGPL